MAIRYSARVQGFQKLSQLSLYQTLCGRGLQKGKWLEILFKNDIPLPFGLIFGSLD
jgi:hypothetical protein